MSPPLPLATTAARPRPRGPTLRVRRYGRNDFERFDEEAARGSHLCVGSASIGKVDIDCKYLWKRAQWGVLGSDRRPAGILYMDVTFRQPHGYWLESGSVWITLSDDWVSSSTTLGSDYAVQMTEYYGPRFLAGATTVRSETKATKLAPSVGAMGFQVGGLGYESSTAHDRLGRWTFKGTVGRPRARLGGGDGLRTLHWELSENAMNPDQAHSQEYRTAFTFEHSRRPVLMRDEVEGKLRSKGRQLKHDLLRFSSHRDTSTLTQMDLSHAGFDCDRRLDAVARGLDMAMQMENVHRGPVQVPDPTPARFTTGDAQGQDQEQQLLLFLARQLESSGAAAGTSGDVLAARLGLREAEDTLVAESTSTPESSVDMDSDRGPEPGQHGAATDDDVLRELLTIPVVYCILRFLALVARYMYSGRGPAAAETEREHGRVRARLRQGGEPVGRGQIEGMTGPATGAAQASARIRSWS